MGAAVPVWLLDVDGVVNAVRPGWGAPPRSGVAWSAVDHYEYRLRWAPALVERIRSLHGSGLVEVRWCSTWCPDATALERLWRFPPLERALTVTPVPPGAHSWPLKLAAAHRMLSAGRRLVWTDDEAIPTADPVLDAAVTAGTALLLRPSPGRGLQPADLSAIETFARGTANPSTD
ncbi:hypothetical protein [Micromonospora echinofusca]|uniref:5' nucleotidase, deoxy (Pyrimidine), type C protein (NT5C) n=1 Tax=Micromonospora echinofusca TaxID=47858 RepID=A0ABS3VSL2_MICEH|nr:hypothetical protein [Micromonospora echinofusca]MBO4207527.1 hypothetical protein [Micromonospora echinofusca]